MRSIVVSKYCISVRKSTKKKSLILPFNLKLVNCQWISCVNWSLFAHLSNIQSNKRNVNRSIFKSNSRFVRQWFRLIQIKVFLLLFLVIFYSLVTALCSHVIKFNSISVWNRFSLVFSFDQTETNAQRDQIVVGCCCLLLQIHGSSLMLFDANQKATFKRLLLFFFTRLSFDALTKHRHFVDNDEWNDSDREMEKKNRQRNEHKKSKCVTRDFEI